MSLVTRSRAQAHKRIVKWGMAAVLRGTSGDRGVVVLEDAFSTRDIDGQRIQRGDRRYFMSAVAGDGSTVAAPDAHDESLILSEDPMDDSASTELIFASPPVRCSPNGTVVYYELHCRNR
jgi:hypothetical protein